MEFIVYFEIFGKKLKVEIEADNEIHAENKIKNRIKFHKIEKKVNKRNQEDLYKNLRDTPLGDIFNKLPWL